MTQINPQDLSAKIDSQTTNLGPSDNDRTIPDDAGTSILPTREELITKTSGIPSPVPGWYEPTAESFVGELVELGLSIPQIQAALVYYGFSEAEANLGIAQYHFDNSDADTEQGQLDDAAAALLALGIPPDEVAKTLQNISLPEDTSLDSSAISDGVPTATNIGVAMLNAGFTPQETYDGLTGGDSPVNASGFYVLEAFKKAGLPSPSDLFREVQGRS